MRTTFRALCFLALIGAGPAPAFAASYQVELIVFAYRTPHADGEQWATDGGLPGREGMAVLGAATGGVPPLPATSYRLNGIMGALRRGGRYAPVLHTSWLQSAPGQYRGVYFSYPAPESTAFSPDPELPRAQGSVRLRVARYLFVDVDVAYLPDAAQPDAPSLPADPVTVRLQESRKIKLNEVHYFDHPLFGVLLQVSRVGGEDASTSE
jgi:hypothetical protein